MVYHNITNGRFALASVSLNRSEICSNDFERKNTLVKHGLNIAEISIQAEANNSGKEQWVCGGHLLWCS